MTRALALNPDRLFSVHESVRGVARELYDSVRDLPIVSPHGHTDPAWFALNENFGSAAELFIKTDHYVFRMLHSQGVKLEDIGIRAADGRTVETDDRKIWRIFAQHYHLFRGTPSRVWLDHVFAGVFGMAEVLCPDTAEAYFERINADLATDAFRPRALFEHFNIEVIATTESPLDDLEHHRAIRDSDWQGRVISTYRPDNVTDPDYEGFQESVEQLGEKTGEDVGTYAGYLQAHRARRVYFRSLGVTATDHSHPTARTADLSPAECEDLYARVMAGSADAADKELFRAQMLTEMATMSAEDGMVMQIHTAPFRNHSRPTFDGFGRDRGADIPVRSGFVKELKPLLDKHGTNPDLSIILFTLDESNYAREFAPLAGFYPCLKLGPPWWFHDSVEGMRRFRQQVTETAGFYNTVGFNDDTRAFMSIPARHDVARRMDCNWLAELVCDHRLDLVEAQELAVDLAYNLAKSAYKL